LSSPLPPFKRSIFTSAEEEEKNNNNNNGSEESRKHQARDDDDDDTENVRLILNVCVLVAFGAYCMYSEFTKEREEQERDMKKKKKKAMETDADPKVLEEKVLKQPPSHRRRDDANDVELLKMETPNYDEMEVKELEIETPMEIPQQTDFAFDEDKKKRSY